MSLNFTTDNSVQLTYSSFPFTPTNLDNYATSNSVYITSNTLNTKINLKQDILTVSTNLLGIGGSISGLDYNKITLNKPTLYTQTETNNLLNAKEQILSFTAPLTRTTNTIGINLGSYSQTGLDSSYLLKTGGILSGDFNIEKLNPIVSIKSTGETQTSIIYLSTPLNISSGLKTAIIAEGVSAWGRSKLHFCLNDNQTDNSTSQNASVSHARLTILPSGNIGINNTSPSEKLDVSGNIKTTGNIDCGGGIALTGANAFYETGSVTDTNETNTYINFKFAGAGNDWCYLRQIGANNFYKLAFDFHDDNNDARFCLRSVQSAGAEPDNFTEVFTVDNGNTSMTGTCTATSFSGSGASLNNIPYSSITSVPDFLLKSGGNLSGTLNGTTINASTIFNVNSVNINNWLFNSTGTNHEALSDFNNINKFGYTFINNIGGTLNGPSGTGDTQFYSWYIGLGADYPAMYGTIGSYGMQFAIGRTAVNPKLSIRRNQNNSWTSWEGITAEKAVSLTSGNKTIDGTLTATNFSGNGSGITSLNYGNITGVPDFLLKSGGILSGSLTVPNITLGVGGKINSVDDYHYIHINQPTDTLTIQEYGTISFNIGPTKTQKAYINSTGLTVSGTCSATNFSGNGANLTNLPLSAYSQTGQDNSYLKLIGGVMSGQITGVSTLNATTGIFSNISTTNNGNASTPSLGVFGGTGDRIILFGGTASVHPYSLGINSAVMWYSVPATSSHIFYVAGSPITTINSTGLSTTGLINATNLQEGGVNITSKYAQLGTSNTLTGNLTINAGLILKNGTWITSMDNVFRIWFDTNGPSYYSCGNTTDNHIFYNSSYSTTFKIQNNGNILATGSISENGTFLSAKYLQLSGGNITGTLNLVPTTGITPLYIYSTAAASINNIELKNNANNSCYIGIGGTSYTGNYVNNLFLQSPNSLILNTGGTGTGSTPKMIILNNGNVGIATTNPTAKLHIQHSSTSISPALGGLYVYNPTNAINNTSIIAARIGGSTALKAMYSLDVEGSYGWSMFINGSDTTYKYLRFNADWSGNGNDILKLGYDGSVIVLGNLTVNGYVGNTHTSFYCTDAINAQYKICFYSSGNIGMGGNQGHHLNFGYFSTNADTSFTPQMTLNTTNGELTVGQSYLGGLRINGGDGNTLYNYGRDLGLLVNTGQSINFSMWGGNGNIMTVNNSGVIIDVDGVPINITNKGIVIGTFGTQYYPFVVSRTINGTLSYVFVRTGYNGGSDYNSSSITGDTSAAFAGQIHVGGNILNSSDIRIKKEINDITDDGALQQILAIQPKTYKYIDYLSKNNGVVYGFIAQQVKEVIPHAVELVKDIIPNIYKRAICDSNIITLENDISQELNINDNIKIYDEFGNDNMYNILEINENVIKIDKDINTSNIFVFGKEVDDFHTLKKDYIFTLNVCATQELYKLIQKQNEVIENLQLQINELKNKL